MVPYMDQKVASNRVNQALDARNGISDQQLEAWHHGEKEHESKKAERTLRKQASSQPKVGKRPQCISFEM
jgi:hypothetical protein